MTEKSVSELIREHILKQFENGYEYTIKYNRRIDRKAIVELLGLDKKKGYDIYNHQFKKVLKQLKKDSSDYLETRFRRPTFSGIKATITAKPQGPIFEPDPVEKIKQEIKQQEPQLQQHLEEQLQQAQKEDESITREIIAEFWQGLWVLLKMQNKYLEDLTYEEKTALGRLWLPFFYNYTSEMFRIVVLPSIITIAMFGKHIVDARRIQKEKNTKLEIQKS